MTRDPQPLGHVDTAILKRFTPWSGTVPAGYFAYFLGNVTRADYWAFSPEIRALYDRERHETFLAPSVDDNIFDWLVLLEAVADAKGTFTMAAAGAGWGRWLVAAAFAARQLGLSTVRLIGVEAEPTHFQWMLEHFRDNQLDPADHDLVEAAVSGRTGEAWFYVGDPDSWYGQSIVQGDVTGSATSDREITHNGYKARRVRTLDLQSVIGRYERVDYLHLDIQGAELDFLSNHPRILDRTVKRVLIGTHSSDIEGGLRRLFTGLGWRAQYDFPLNSQLRVDQTAVTLGDGVQVWINPGL
jgi:FkbM family methyltransferase